MARKKQQYGLGSIFRKKAKDPLTGAERELPNYYIQFFHDGRCYRESTGTAVYNEAQRKLKERIGEVARGILPVAENKHVTVNMLLDDLLAYYQRKNPKSAKTMAEPCLKRLRRQLGDYKPGKIETAQLEAFVDTCIGEELSPATINRHLALLRKAYKLGEQHRPRKVAPHEIPNIAHHMQKENNARRGFLSHEEYERLRNALEGSERAAVTFAYYSGCRISEILGLQWDQVDWGGRLVRLWSGQTKNDEGRVLPLGDPSQELYQMMVAQLTGAPDGCPWIFYRGNGKRVVTLRYGWKDAKKATNIDRLVHDLRRTAVRNMIRADVPEVVARRISGHKTASVFNRYNIVDEADLHAAAGKLATYVGAQVTVPASCAACAAPMAADARFCGQCGKAKI